MDNVLRGYKILIYYFDGCYVANFYYSGCLVEVAAVSGGENRLVSEKFIYFGRRVGG